MKVLLIQPAPPRAYWPRGAFRSHWVPSGLAFLAAGLKRDGHEVRVHVREEQLAKREFDWDAADTALRSELTEFRPEAIGLSVMTPAVAEAQRIAAWGKELLCPDVLTIAGGPHPSALPEEMLAECPDIDVLAVGEAEHTLRELLTAGLRRDVKGIVYRDGEGFVHTPPREPETDLDSLGPPAHELFDMAGYYTAANRWMLRWMKLRVMNVRASRGCPSRCRFCAGHVVAGLGVRYHSLEYIIDQLRNAADHYGVEGVHFEDDTVGSDSDWLIELCRAIRREGLHRRLIWDCCLRVDQAEPELLGEMKRAGCVQIEYGFESGSDSALRRLGKGASVEANRRAVGITREAGLRIFANILLALPGETEAEQRETMRFLRWARPEVISAIRLAPLPGTPLFDSMGPEFREGLDWGRLTYMGSHLGLNLTAMSDHRLERLCRRLERYTLRAQMIRAMLRDTPPIETGERYRLRRKLRRFILHHPIEAAFRVPW